MKRELLFVIRHTIKIMHFLNLSALMLNWLYENRTEIAEFLNFFKSLALQFTARLFLYSAPKFINQNPPFS